MRAGAAALAALMFSATAALAGHKEPDSDYPGSWAIPDGHGGVTVKVQYLAMGACWRIDGAREGVPERATADPGDRHLYVTVSVRKTGDQCPTSHAPIETKLTIPDKPGRISLDVFFVDERGVLQRSQRHRIERDCGASTTAAC